MPQPPSAAHVRAPSAACRRSPKWRRWSEQRVGREEAEAGREEAETREEGGGRDGERGSRVHKGYFTQSSQRAEFLSGGGSPACGRPHRSRDARFHKCRWNVVALVNRASLDPCRAVARPTASLTCGLFA